MAMFELDKYHNKLRETKEKEKERMKEMKEKSKSK